MQPSELDGRIVLASCQSQDIIQNCDSGRERGLVRRVAGARACELAHCEADPSARSRHEHTCGLVGVRLIGGSVYTKRLGARGMGARAQGQASREREGEGEGKIDKVREVLAERERERERIYIYI